MHTGQCHCNLLYGGDGNDHLDALDTKEEGRDKLYCGDGWDKYRADPNDYVSSSCEKGTLWEDGKLYDTGGRLLEPSHTISPHFAHAAVLRFTARLVGGVRELRLMLA